MEYTRESILARLEKSYERFYNVYLLEDEQTPVAARCDYFEHSEKYFLSKKAELWSSDSEEFLYLLDFPHLTLEQFEKWRDYVREDGMSRMHIGPGHMYSFVTPIFICDTCDDDARRALRRCHIYKSFHFSLYGWMDYHTALIEVSTGRVEGNSSGRLTVKNLKEILYPKKRKES